MDRKRYIKMKAVKWIGAYIVASVFLVGGLILFDRMNILGLNSSFAVYFATIVIWIIFLVIIEMIYRRNPVYMDYLKKRKEKRK